MIVVRPDGTVVEVPDDHLQQAADAGYRKANDKEVVEFQAKHQPLTAAVEAGYRGMTFGLSDPYTKLAYPEAAAGMAPRGEANPVAATVGELGGALATGGIGDAAVAKAGLQGLSKVVAGNAVQGGLWGAGAAISESSLGDTELTGQKLAAGAVSGGLVNAALGTAFHGIGVGVSRLAKKAALPAVGDMLGKAADMSEKHALGIADHPFADEVLQRARAEGLVSVTASPAKVVAQATTKREAAGQVLGNILTEADKASAPRVPEIRAAADAALAKYRRLPTHDAAVAHAERIISGFEEREGHMAPTTWAEVFKTQSDILKSVEATAAPTTKAVLKDVQVALRDYVERGAEAALPPWRQGQFMSAIKDYAQFSTLVDAGEAAAGRARDKLAGAVGYGGLGLVMGHPVLGVAAGVAKKVLEPRAGFIAGAAFRKLSESGMLAKVADTFMKQVLPLTEVLPFAIRQRLSQAAAQGSMEFLAEHARLAQADPTYLQTLGLQNESPEEVANLGPRLAAVSAVDDTAQAVTQQFDAAVEKFFGGAGRPGRISAGRATLRDFEAMRSAVERINQNPEDIFQSMSSDLTAHAPMTAGAAMATVATAAQFLDSKMPKDPNAGLPSAIRRPWEPAAPEVARWFRYVDAIENPSGVIERAKHGAVAPEHLEALQAVYPSLLNEVRARMTETLGRWGKPLPYSKRVGMAAFLGSAVLSMQPEQVALIQQSHATVSPPVASKPDGRQKIDAVKNTQTQAQRLEGR